MNNVKSIIAMVCISFAICMVMPFQAVAGTYSEKEAKTKLFQTIQEIETFLDLDERNLRKVKAKTRFSREQLNNMVSIVHSFAELQTVIQRLWKINVTYSLGADNRIEGLRRRALAHENEWRLILKCAVEY